MEAYISYNDSKHSSLYDVSIPHRLNLNRCLPTRAFSTFGSSVYTPGISDVAVHFHISDEASILGLSLYVLGLALGPVISAPISETLGRRAVYLGTFPISMLFILGAGLAQDFATLLVCRFLAGAIGSGALAVGAGTVSDLWPVDNRAAAASLYLFSGFLGPALGPAAGGYAVQKENWRWSLWLVLFVGASACALTLPSRETYKKTILQKRAKRLDLSPPETSLPPGLSSSIKFLLFVTIFRPLRMLVTEPIVAYFSIYIAFNFSILFAFFDAFPIVFGKVYHFNTGESGLVFLGVGFGCVIATIIMLIVDTKVYKKQRLSKQASGDNTPLEPEQRLYGAMIGSMMLPLGLFWFAWTARKEVHWISPILATVPFGAGNLLVFCSAVLYMIDTYGPLGGASATAANGLLRYTSGAAFPLFTTQMYRTLGIAWATSLLGFVSIALLPVPWILFKYGPQIRARSSYT